LNNNNNNNRNNNNNNRRRGRGNRQQGGGGGGGGNQNRIDSRARGNAPQMLDKFKKLAQDAAHHGDRVQAEYYLQFADHYFRVIADNRARQDESRGGAAPRRDERDFSDDDEDYNEFDSPRPIRDDRPREDRQREDRQRDDRPREDRAQAGGSNGNDRNRNRPRRDDEGRMDEPRFDEGEQGSEGEEASGFEGGGNPFTRREPIRAPRGQGQRRNARDKAPDRADESATFDAGVLPPSISAAAVATAPSNSEGEDDAPRKPATRRRRKPADDAGGDETLTAVG
jgi:hypothetical protein